jgi:hypothetical protein
MTRREFLSSATLVAAGAPSRAGTGQVVPVRRVMDGHARCTREELNRFWWSIWPEAVRSFGRGGIELKCTDAHGEIRLSPGGRPMFYGLERGVLNLVITDHLPASWDSARALAGMTAWHAGYCVSVIALRYAHGNQLPLISLNTCVHELLHALLQDVFVTRPKWYQAGAREERIDWYATGLWLFHDGSAIRQSSGACLKRLQTAAAAYIPRGSSTTSAPSVSPDAIAAWVEF